MVYSIFFYKSHYIDNHLLQIQICSCKDTKRHNSFWISFSSLHLETNYIILLIKNYTRILYYVPKAVFNKNNYIWF